MRFGHQRLDTFACGLVHTVGFVERHDRGDRLDAVDVGQHVVDGVDLGERVGMRAVDHVHDQVVVGDFLQRGFERFDELRWQAAHETDGVDIRVQSPVLGFRTAYGGIQSGEQRVLHQFRGTGQPVGQRRFAGVRIADHGDGRQAEATARATFDVTRGRHLCDLPA